MELLKNLQWMCRVCAVNIKKRRSTAAAVSIFENADLVEKLRKYLFMDLSSDDELPKIICSNCFKKLESIHNFAALAKKTENFLKDFISIAQNNIKDPAGAQFVSTRFQNEFASFALLSTTAAQPELLFFEEKPQDHEEVILNFTVNDPLSKNVQDKIASATKRLMPPVAAMMEVKTSNKIKKSQNLLSIKDKNTLEQKRQNLKRILSNNNAQGSAAQVAANSSKEQSPDLRIPTNFNSISSTTSPVLTASIPHLLQPGKVQQSPIVYDCLNLGCVIKDVDLLKLILKALKWPYTKETLNVQLNRLKNTRFRDVMVDSNLLQDTDLMQIISSYLGPILLHQQQQSNFLSVLPTVAQYKIPSDTSVHLITVPPEEEKSELRNTSTYESQSRRSKHRKILPKLNPIKCTSPIEILSDDSLDGIQRFEVSIDPDLYFSHDSESYDNSNLSMMMVKTNLASKKIRTYPPPENTAKIRKKQRKKDTVKKVPPSMARQDDVAQSQQEEDHEAAAILENVNDRDKINFKSNTDSPKEDEISSHDFSTEFPLVAIIEENSNDDAIWAEFKVIDSPTQMSHSEGRIEIPRNTKIKEEVTTEDEEQPSAVITPIPTEEVAADNEKVTEDKAIVEEEAIVEKIKEEPSENDGTELDKSTPQSPDASTPESPAASTPESPDAIKEIVKTIESSKPETVLAAVDEELQKRLQESKKYKASVLRTRGPNPILARLMASRRPAKNKTALKQKTVSKPVKRVGRTAKAAK